MLIPIVSRESMRYSFTFKADLLVLCILLFEYLGMRLITTITILFNSWLAPIPGVVELTTYSFKNEIEKGMVFVKCCAPWYEHCKWLHGPNLGPAS